MPSDVNIVVAMCHGNRGVGYKGALPWPLLKEDHDYYLDLCRSRKNTDKKILHIQGRKTWQCASSVRKSDPNIIHVIISSRLDLRKEDSTATIVPTYEDALKFALTPEVQSQIEAIWIMGGEGVWKSAIEHPSLKRIYLTRIYEDFKSDIFFPPFEDKFERSSDPDLDGKMRVENGVHFQFEVYTRTL